MNRLKTIVLLLMVAFVEIRGDDQTTNVASTGELETSPAVDPHFAEKIQTAGREQQEQFRPRIAIEDAVGDDVPLATTRGRMPEPLHPPRVWLNDNRTLLLAFGAVALAAAFLSRRFLLDLLTALNAGLNPWIAASGTAARIPDTVRAEETGLAEFLAALKAGPLAADGAVDSLTRSGGITIFQARVTPKLGHLRQMAREIRRTSDKGARHKILAALRWELHSIRTEAGVAALQSVWHLAFATEGLLKQLSENAGNVTPSALRSLRGSLELLEDLSRPEIAPDLLTRKPLQLLAVDDDPIGRTAVSCALARALNKPELAADCEAALALATAKTYDVIFLDVQMPRMDGFELCTRIHETAANRNTPVVFITSHSDFETRARGTLAGSVDLMGKPFLTFEITVKALTVILRSRLGAVGGVRVAAEKAMFPTADESSDDARSSQAFLDPAPGAMANTEARQIADAFLTGEPDRLLPLREAFQDLLKATDSVARRDLLGDIFVYVHSFIHADLPAAHPVVRLRAALEALLKKLLENPASHVQASFFALVTGLQVLDELCQAAAMDRLVEQPFRMLVVDADPVSRRGLVNALQTVCEQPTEAESVDAAIQVARSQAYDVVLMDAQMSITDGCDVNERIHESTTNACTPVIIVASRGDEQAWARACASGASDFIEKPFLDSELILKALSFALRSRLNRIGENEARSVASPCA